MALNIDDSEAPDNVGDAPSVRIIQPRGPVAYRSTLPLRKFMDALKSRGLPVEISSNAGTFVCNHVFYSARYEIEQVNPGGQCGFIHVPLMLEQAEAFETSCAIPLAVMVEAVTSCIDLLYEESD
jgi:pyroglutamyl-peptidase